MQANLRWLTILIFCVPLVVFAAEDKAVKPVKPDSRDVGTLVVKYERSNNKTYKEIAIYFKEHANLTPIFTELNKALIMPENLTLVFKDSDRGPVYYHRKNEIAIGYGFIDFVSRLYKASYPKASDDEVIDFTVKIVIFFFYHELAHALIDIYNLPVIGPEESAADNLAGIISLEYTKDGFAITMAAAIFWELLRTVRDQKTKAQERDYWNEHELDPQRFYRTLCMAYGKKPEKVREVIKASGNKILLEFIEEQGDYCIREYPRINYAWHKLLEHNLNFESSRAKRQDN